MLNYDDILTIAFNFTDNKGDEEGLAESFSNICLFLQFNQDLISGRIKNNQINLFSENGIKLLAQKYFNAFRKSDFPTVSQTVPDELVGVVLQVVYDYSAEDYLRIRDEHQKAMSAENCIGALLERYLDFSLRPYGWNWCCGNFVKATDFLKKDKNNQWILIQIKNRDNSENSSSSAIRYNTSIEKWFRSFSRTGKTNWNNLPIPMRGYNLSEEGFIKFAQNYLEKEKFSQMKI